MVKFTMIGKHKRK